MQSGFIDILLTTLKTLASSWSLTISSMYCLLFFYSPIHSSWIVEIDWTLNSQWPASAKNSHFFGKSLRQVFFECCQGSIYSFVAMGHVVMYLKGFYYLDFSNEAASWGCHIIIKLSKTFLFENSNARFLDV